MTIVSEFYNVVQTNSDAPALMSTDEGIMSYSELNQQANSIAVELCCLKQDSVVGVLLKKSFSLFAAILGVMKAGMAYLPLDPSYPAERLIWMITNSNVSVIISDEETALKLTNSTIKVLDVNKQNKALIDNIDCSNCESTACVLYTSGSTGVPCGVMMSHSAILNTVKWMINNCKLSPRDVDLQISSISFASSVEDIFATLLSGGVLILPSTQKMLNARYLTSLIRQYNVTHFDMVPSLYKELLQYISGINTLRFVILAGEPLSLQLVRKHFSVLPLVKLYNEYGKGSNFG